MQKIIVIGNLTQDARIVKFETGELAELSVAVNESGYTTRSGRVIEPTTEYFTCIVRGGLVKVAEGWCKKGTKVAIEGKIKTRKYTGKDGVERSAWSVIVENLELCGGRAAAASSTPAPVPEPAPVPASQLSETAQSIQATFGGQWHTATEEPMPF